MSTIPFFLADADTEAILATWRSDPAVLERILIFGAIGLVTGLTLLWAVFIRKRRRRRRAQDHSHHRSSGAAEVPESPKDESPPAQEEKRRHHRHSRRRHRRRNPTLAETGGLPPIRPESVSESEP
jgi:hypothetical protein